MRFAVRTLALALLAAACAYPAWAFESSAGLTTARNIFLNVVDHKGGSLDEAQRSFEALAGREPANPLYLSYLGACMALRGDAAWMPWKKMQFTEQGLEMLDKALAMLNNPEPGRPMDFHDLLETKLVAAQTFIQTPDSIFHRAAMGKRLLSEIRGAAQYASTNPVFRARVESLNSHVKENG
ncbi:MAG: hypothetical protein HZB29_02735 [Nitrospinae bacterium]|nr:hypothetical protein [Nitrospinota bacterium]